MVFLVSFIFFYHRNFFLYSTFLFLWKFIEILFFETMQTRLGCISSRRLFLTFDNLTFIKRTWDQSNNFSLKIHFLVIKQTGILRNFQKFKCKLQWAYYVYSFSCMTSLTSRHCLIIQNFASSYVHYKW